MARHWRSRPTPREHFGWGGWVEVVVATTMYLCGLIAIAFVLSVLVFALILLGAGYRPAHGQQHTHAQHHASYQSWTNKNGEGCCNNQDCGELAESNERTSRGFLEVRIEGQWCPVQAHHYLRSGNVPNAATSHVCVWHPAARPDLPHPCQRLLCYQPRPLM